MRDLTIDHIVTAIRTPDATQRDVLEFYEDARKGKNNTILDLIMLILDMSK
jgi:hypothetical protein